MTDTHDIHLHQQHDHALWRQRHMEALSILKRVEARIYAHEARILAHEAEIARAEYPQAHQTAAAEAAMAAEDARFTAAHEAEARHNPGLFDAIRALVPHLDGGA
ncbi:MAG: hypothetical protein IE922_17275 [Sphingomonadales bacterium]|nr:hypothetical protein [Sphingomonadales bacterium]